MSQLPVFVLLGSGRCGSTLISELLEMHPRILSLSEFLVPLLMSGLRDPAARLSAAEFCAALSRPLPTTTALLRAGISVPEFRYRFDRPDARYQRKDGVPFPLAAALPRLTDDPDGAFAALLAHVADAGGDCLAAHLDATFQALTTWFGGAVLVERSGGSLAFAAEFQRLLPRAQMLLLTRDGPETALSMHRYPYFRHILLRAMLTGQLGYDPYTDDRRDGACALPEALRQQLPECFTRDGFESVDLPVEAFGAMWAQHTRRGLAALPPQVPHLAYERLCADPGAVLAGLAKWLGVAADQSWIEAASARIRPPGLNSRALPQETMARLHAACAPGTEALARKGIA